MASGCLNYLNMYMGTGILPIPMSGIIGSGCPSSWSFNGPPPQTHPTFDTFTNAKCWQCGKFFKVDSLDPFDSKVVDCPNCGVEGEI